MGLQVTLDIYISIQSERISVVSIHPVFVWVVYAILLFEPPHDKTDKMACAPTEDSDQPVHPPSLIKVFTVRMKKVWVL